MLCFQRNSHSPPYILPLIQRELQVIGHDISREILKIWEDPGTCWLMRPFINLLK